MKNAQVIYSLQFAVTYKIQLQFASVQAYSEETHQDSIIH